MSKQTAISRFGLHQENMGCARLDKWPKIRTCLACEAMSSHSVSKNADEADDFQFLRIINAPPFPDSLVDYSLFHKHIQIQSFFANNGAIGGHHCLNSSIMVNYGWNGLPPDTILLVLPFFPC